MLIYNVTTHTLPEVADSWLAWMKEEHIPEMMHTGLFKEYRICRLLNQDDADGLTFVIQYICDSPENLETYMKEHDENMRMKGHQKFGGKIIGIRTAMSVIG